MRKMKTMKKLLVWLLVCAMFVTLAPSSALAAVEEETVEAINVTDEEEAAKDDIVVEEEVEEEEVSQDVEAPAAEADIAEPEAEDDMDDIVQVFEDTDDYSIKADGDDPAPSGDNAPQTVKTAKPNGDGTSKIRLDITGKVNKTQDVTKANVIFVIDLSNSMDETSGGKTRLAVAKSALISASTELLKLNSKIEGVTDVVEIGIVSFASIAKTRLTKSTSLSDITTTVNNLTLANGERSNGGGTNWEAALKAANEMSFNDSDDTYVVFLSDGNPTFRLTQGTGSDAYGRNVDGTTVYGTGNSDPNNNNFNYAVNQARQMTGKKIYSIGCFGNVTKMNSFNTTIGGAGYYNATDEAALNAALSEIAKAISDSLGQSDVSTTDGVTDLSTVSAEVVSGSVTDFVYYKDGAAWANAPKAKFENNKVVWDLSSVGTLEDGVTYSVEFDVWPSQEAYDLIADLNNGIKKYSELTDAQKAQIDDLGGSYALKTNTDLSTSYTYNGKQDTATLDAGNYAMALLSSYIGVEKEWENTLDGREAKPIKLKVMKGTDEYFEVEVSADTEWKHDNIAIAPGIIRKGVVLEHGHDYSVAESASDSYYWDLEAAVYHPMIIDGVLTLLKEDANGSYEIDGKKYSKTTEDETTLKAYNYRRSYLNLTKKVTDNSEGVAPKDAKFEYTINVVDKNAAANENKVWFSVTDKDGNIVKDITTSATAEEGNTGYYYGTSGEDFTVELQADWNLRLINLPIGSTYTIEETDMPGGFYFAQDGIDYKYDSKSTPRYEEKDPTKAEKKISGEIYNTNTAYTVTYTNEYDGFFYVYHTSMTGSDAGVIETFEMRDYKDKTFDIFAKTATGTYYGGYYDNYYYAGKVDITTNPAKPTVTGGTKYEGQAVGFYKTKAKAYTETGTAIKPKAGTVYYLKEVPTSYINAKVYVRYNSKDHLSEPNKVNKIEPITCIDDKNYTEQGFYFNTTKTPVTKLASVFIETKEGEQTRNENGTSLFSTPNKGYLAIDDYTSKITAKSTNTIQPYWITPDKIEVKGTQKTITVSGDLVYPGVDVK